jgi:hypothetical protein
MQSTFRNRIASVILISGTLVMVGSIGQLILGFLVGGGVTSLRTIHQGIGVLGLFSVLILTGLILKVESLSVSLKLFAVALTVILIAQVYVGFEILGGAESLVVAHEVNGLLVVVFLTILILTHSSLS